MTRHRLPKQRGGATSFFTLRIETVPRSARSYTVILSSEGGYLHPAEFSTPGTPMQTKNFTDLFLNTILSGSAGQTAQAATLFRPLSIEKDTTFGNLMNMYNSIMTVPQGPSLAAYRAYSLLSLRDPAVDRKIGYTYICQDPLKNKVAGNEVQFATLESLYLDIPDTERSVFEGEATSELSTVLSKFQADASYKVQRAGSSPVTFIDLQIPDVVPTTFATFCNKDKGVITSPIKSDKPTRIDILKQGHVALRKEYDQHIRWVNNFVKTRLMIIRAADKKIVLHSSLAFPKDSRGNFVTIQKKLEERVQEARKQIAEHYKRVETIYRSTILSMASATA
jgi:hypothetical protein